MSLETDITLDLFNEIYQKEEKINGLSTGGKTT